ncbi:MAG: hypothetical protein WAN58_21600, partial [Anaerolineales bacterium]
YEPSGENLLKIAQKLGREIYDILGIESPAIADPLLNELVSSWDNLSEEVKQTFLKKVREKSNQKPIKKVQKQK